MCIDSDCQAVLFWGWLKASGIPSFFLLELDGLTCDAASAINPSLTFECATVEDMLLPTRLTQMRRAGALQEWGACLFCSTCGTLANR